MFYVEREISHLKIVQLESEVNWKSGVKNPHCTVNIKLAAKDQLKQHISSNLVTWFIPMMFDAP